MMPDDDTFQPDCGCNNVSPARELPAMDRTAADLTAVLVPANNLIKLVLD